MTNLELYRVKRRCSLLRAYLSVVREKTDLLLTYCLQRDPTELEKKLFFLAPGEMFEKKYWPKVKDDFCRRRKIEIYLEDVLLPYLSTDDYKITKKEFLSDPAAYLDEHIFRYKKELDAWKTKAGLPDDY